MVLISQRFAMRSKSNGRVFLSFFVKTAGPVICRMLSYAPTRRALVVGCGLQMFQQLSGINTIMYVSLSACSWKVCAGSISQGRQERVLHCHSWMQRNVLWACLMIFKNPSLGTMRLFVFGILSLVYVLYKLKLCLWFFRIIQADIFLNFIYCAESHRAFSCSLVMILEHILSP